MRGIPNSGYFFLCPHKQDYSILGVFSWVPHPYLWELPCMLVHIGRILKMTWVVRIVVLTVKVIVIARSLFQPEILNLPPRSLTNKS